MTSTHPDVCCPDLLSAFVVLADALADDCNVADLLQCLVETCCRELAVDAAVSVVEYQRGEQHVMAYTAEGVLRLAVLELEVQEGPCLESCRTGQVVSAEDLTRDLGRWSQFASCATQEGLRAVHVLPMLLRAETVGVLSLFTAAPGPLPARDLRVGQALADVATIGLLHQRALRGLEDLANQLQTALDIRVVIEGAKGILAERSGLGFPEVFELLRAHARRTRMRLSDVARGVLDGSVTVEVPLREAKS